MEKRETLATAARLIAIVVTVYSAGLLRGRDTAFRLPLATSHKLYGAAIRQPRSRSRGWLRTAVQSEF